MKFTQKSKLIGVARLLISAEIANFKLYMAYKTQRIFKRYF